MRERTRLLSLLLFAVLPACGDNPTAPPGPPEVELPEPTGPTSAVIGTAGGTLTATTAEGVIVVVQIPAAAVRAATEMTLRPVEPADGALFGALLEPAGLQFAAPFTVSVTLPATIPLNDARLLLADVPLATQVDAGRRVISTTALSFFGYPPPEPAGAAWQPMATYSGSIAAAAGPGASNQLGAAALNCAALAAGAQQRIDAFLAGGNLEAAHAAFLNLGAVVLEGGCDPAAAIDQAVTKLCEASGAGLAELRDRPITAYGHFREQAERILAWAVLLQLLPGNCGADGDYIAVLDAKLDAFIVFYEQRLQALQGEDYGTFQNLKDEALRVFATGYTAAMLGVTDAMERIDERAFVPTLDRMRQVAYGLCRTRGWHYPVTRLTSVGFFAARDIIGYPPARPGELPAVHPYADFSDDDIFRDIQYCGSALDLSSPLPSGDTLATVEAGGGEQPGAEQADVSLEVYTRGRIVIDGDLRGFTCWGDTAADERVELALNTNVVHTLERPGKDDYLPGEAIDLDVREVTEPLGITPKEGTPTQLVLTRFRDHCSAQLWGPDQFRLVNVDVQWRNPELEIEIELPDTVTPGESADLAVRVAVIDPKGEREYYDDIEIELTLVGGTAGTLSGRTDEEGWFRTTVVAEEDAAQLEVSVDAKSFEGVTQTGQDAAAIRGEPFRVTPLHECCMGYTSRAYVYTGGASIEPAADALFDEYDLATEGTNGTAELSAKYFYDQQTESLDSLTMRSRTTGSWGTTGFYVLIRVNERAQVRFSGTCSVESHTVNDGFWVSLNGEPGGDITRYFSIDRRARAQECWDIDGVSEPFGPGTYRINIAQSGSFTNEIEYELKLAFEKVE